MNAQTRRDVLRERLIDLAEHDIRDAGMDALRARSLAKRAECAVGAIYTVFDDMTGLVMAVNGRTFRRLGDHVRRAVAEAHAETPTERLVTMARAYHSFAGENPNLWRSLFDVKMSVDRDVPEWYLAELGMLFALIAQPLKEIFTADSAEDIDLKTRALFSSIHGIVLLGSERRISSVPSEKIESMIGFLLRNVTSQTDS